MPRPTRTKPYKKLNVINVIRADIQPRSTRAVNTRGQVGWRQLVEIAIGSRPTGAGIQNRARVSAC